MSYEVETNPYLRLVVCTMWGLVWVEERHAALDETLAQIDEGKSYRILVDMIGASCANDSLEASSAFARRMAGERRFRRYSTMSDALDWLLSPATRLRPAPAVALQAEPDAMTLLAGLRSGRWVA